MAKVILVSPHYVDLYGGFDEAIGRYFPLGLGYLASYLRRYGQHQVTLYEMDAQKLTLADMAEIFRREQPDVVGLTSSTPNYLRAIEVAKIAKKHSAAKTILGGVHASALSEFILSTDDGFIDCIVRGEGEITVLELINAYQNKASLDAIKGNAYKREVKIALTPERPFIDNLDLIPFPARDLLPQELFVPNMHNARHRKAFSILTSRGCPFNCSFCASRLVSGRKYRTHSAEYVLAEMEMLKKDYGAEQFIITDDTFTMDNDRAKKICQGMIDRKLEIEWFCFSQGTLWIRGC